MTSRFTSTLRRLAASATLAIASLATLGLAGCASPTPADYASQGPKLDLKQYFNGKLLAHGIVTDRSGKVLQRFTALITGTWVGDTGTLKPLPRAVSSTCAWSSPPWSRPVAHTF